PAGTLASTTRSRNKRPSPLHFEQGSLITLPAPWHVGQVRAMLKNPCWYLTCPRPLQALHATGAFPAAAPLPRHESQLSCRRTFTDLSTPNTASSNSRFKSSRRSAPR